MNIESFRNTMRNYSYYQQELDIAKEKLKLVYHTLSGLKSVDPGKIPITGKNQEYQEMKLLDKYEEIDDLKKEIVRLELNIAYADSLLERVPKKVRLYCRELFIRGKTYDSVALRNGITTNQLKYAILQAVKDL